MWIAPFGSNGWHEIQYGNPGRSLIIASSDSRRYGGGGVVLVILGDFFSSNCFSGLGWMIF